MRKNYWKELKQHLESNRSVVILGEKHGARVNPIIIDAFVRHLDIQVIMVELETIWQKPLHNLRYANTESFFRLIRNEPWVGESGVIGREHMRLFTRYLHEGKRIIPIVNGSHHNWNVAEQKNATIVSKFLNRNPKERVLVVVGNLHARKRRFPISIGGRRQLLTPLGARLGDGAVTVLIRYARAQIYNFGIHTIKDTSAIRQLRTMGSKRLTPSRSRYFDYDYFVANSFPITLI